MDANCKNKLNMDHLYCQTDTNYVRGLLKENKHLKAMLLLHLDLIQEQSDQLTTKDKLITTLREENNSLKLRLERFERRNQLRSNGGSNINNNKTIPITNLSPSSAIEILPPPVIVSSTSSIPKPFVTVTSSLNSCISGSSSQTTTTTATPSTSPKTLLLNQVTNDATGFKSIKKEAISHEMMVSSVDSLVTGRIVTLRHQQQKQQPSLQRQKPAISSPPAVIQNNQKQLQQSQMKHQVHHYYQQANNKFKIFEEKSSSGSIIGENNGKLISAIVLPRVHLSDTIKSRNLATPIKQQLQLQLQQHQLQIQNQNKQKLQQEQQHEDDQNLKQQQGLKELKVEKDLITTDVDLIDINNFAIIANNLNQLKQQQESQQFQLNNIIIKTEPDNDASSTDSFHQQFFHHVTDFTETDLQDDVQQHSNEITQKQSQENHKQNEQEDILLDISPKKMEKDGFYIHHDLRCHHQETAQETQEAGTSEKQERRYHHRRFHHYHQLRNKQRKRQGFLTTRHLYRTREWENNNDEDDDLSTVCAVDDIDTGTNFVNTSIENCSGDENSRSLPPSSQAPIKPGISNLEIPKWTVKEFTGLYSIEGTEDLSDDVFLKRHSKFEHEEKRRKKWDVQRIREQRTIERLKRRHCKNEMQQIDADSQEITSFYPTLDQIKFIQITDDLPVQAFGDCIPRILTTEFSLPWRNAEKKNTSIASNSLPSKSVIKQEPSVSTQYTVDTIDSNTTFVFLKKKRRLQSQSGGLTPSGSAKRGKKSIIVNKQQSQG